MSRLGPKLPLLISSSNKDTPQHWCGLAGSGRGLAIAQTLREHKGLLLLVTEDTHTAWIIEQEIRFFSSGLNAEIRVFPDWETLPYDLFSPHEDIISQRLEVLSRLPQIQHGVLIVPVSTAMSRLAPRNFLDAYSLVLSKGQKCNIESFRERLERAGYFCTPQVMAHGEFAVRGAIFDVFPMGSSQPYRVELFDDEIESMRVFDPETQLSKDKVESISLLPGKEYPWDSEAIKRFRQNFRQSFEMAPKDSSVYRQISEGLPVSGIEYYLPLFFEETATLFDYLPKDCLCFTTEQALEAARHFESDINERYEQRRHDRDRPLLRPERLYLNSQQIEDAIRDKTWITLHTARGEPANASDVSGDAELQDVPPIGLEMRAATPAKALDKFMSKPGLRTLFLADSAGRREYVLESLRGCGIRPKIVNNWVDFESGNDAAGIAVAPMESGLHWPDQGLAIITEPQLFGTTRAQQRRRRTSVRDPAQIIRDLTDLSEGSPVVHEDNGVGRYRGLVFLSLGGVDGEFLLLEYADGDKLYVPVADLHLISRYTGADPEHAPLHRLGSEQWGKAKRKAAEQARDAAAELLEIYARRQMRKGFAIGIDQEQYRAFAATFPFEETPDQERTIEEVLSDLQRDQPSDRLVCGDVGFGKTEVAMRAAFVVAMAGFQVAVLTPTTLLAQQHFTNFSDRFADWPIKIELLSRFRSAKQLKDATDAVAVGNADIVIGTHKLLQEGVKYKNLGLMIVDEEHRFGVRDKERLKALRADVHVLTLTATPIPRTLNMSLNKLRDLSIIATPPVNRHAIKTFVSEWNDALLREAVMRELQRGGQVYFLHNDIKSIKNMERQIVELLPQVKVRIAHGQMRERELEQVMLDFYHQRFNLLLCTTIIESGIDVPNANTIIINRADKLGLSQLHQIRGRVGRSHHRAYAYLVTPPRKLITKDAIKRLEAIESSEELGVGFTLATHDLEIRGAGELLGEGQSGQIQEIGFSMYQDLLDRAVRALRNGKIPNLDDMRDHGPKIDLGAPALLPSDYIPDVHMRLVMYKRISFSANEEGLRELQVEMIDRFGLLPERAKTLVEIVRLKHAITPLGIEKLEAHENGLRLTFGPQPNIDSTRLIRIIQRESDRYAFDGQNKLKLKAPLKTVQNRLDAIHALLEQLAIRAAA